MNPGKNYEPLGLRVLDSVFEETDAPDGIAWRVSDSKSGRCDLAVPEEAK